MSRICDLEMRARSLERDVRVKRIRLRYNLQRPSKEDRVPGYDKSERDFFVVAQTLEAQTLARAKAFMLTFNHP